MSKQTLTETPQMIEQHLMAQSRAWQANNPAAQIGHLDAVRALVGELSAAAKKKGFELGKPTTRAELLTELSRFELDADSLDEREAKDLLLLASAIRSGELHILEAARREATTLLGACTEKGSGSWAYQTPPVVETPPFDSEASARKGLAKALGCGWRHRTAIRDGAAARAIELRALRAAIPDLEARSSRHREAVHADAGWKCWDTVAKVVCQGRSAIASGAISDGPGGAKNCDKLLVESACALVKCGEVKA